jgi:hypothetical protein
MPKPQANRNALALGALLIGASTLGALTFYAVTPQANRVPVEQLREGAKPSPASQTTTEKPLPAGTVNAPTARYQGDDLVFDQKPVRPQAGQDRMVFAVNQYLAGLSFVGKEARVTSIKIKDRIATLDFSEAIYGGYGSEDEQTLVKGILETMSQFENVGWVKFTVEGQTLDSLGHLDLSDPQPVENRSSAPRTTEPQREATTRVDRPDSTLPNTPSGP